MATQKLINLYKLRPGDIVFTTRIAGQSLALCAGIAGRFSHAMIVVYLDIWFETNGAGSGFLPIHGEPGFKENGDPVFVAVTPYWQFEVLRLKQAPSAAVVLAATTNNMALEYPDWFEFLPLIVGFRHFPKRTDILVRRLRRNECKKSGDYCSQLVYRMLHQLIPSLSNATEGYHVTPSALCRSLKRLPGTAVATADVLFGETVAKPDVCTRDKLVPNLKIVTDRMRAFQYPHNRDHFADALRDLFRRHHIKADPRKLTIDQPTLQSILTRPNYFAVPRMFWSKRYQ